MVLEDLLGALREGSKLISNRDDDMYDRLSNRWSIGILFMLAFLLTSHSYIGDPIDCFEPAEFEDQWVEYMDNICWVSNTYYVPFNESIPDPSLNQPHKQEIQYYQWVPIVITLQAFLFMIPGMFWNTVAEGSGYNIKEIVKTCKDAESLNPDTRDETITYLVNNMVRFIQYRKPYKKRRMPVGKRYGKFVFLMYMVTKLLYIANAVGQIYLLDVILGDGYTLYGWQALKDLTKAWDWQTSPMFPRITLCSFEIRRLGLNIHRYTVQCLLSVNLFNEKAFIILWWWLVYVAGMSIFGLIVWVATASTPASQKAYVKKYLRIMGRRNNDEDVGEFVSDFLRTDGVFTLRQIAKNTSDAIVGEVTAALWDKYVDSLKDRTHLEETSA